MGIGSCVPHPSILSPNPFLLTPNHVLSTISTSSGSSCCWTHDVVSYCRVMRRVEDAWWVSGGCREGLNNTHLIPPLHPYTHPRPSPSSPARNPSVYSLSCGVGKGMERMDGGLVGKGRGLVVEKRREDINSTTPIPTPPYPTYNPFNILFYYER